MVKKVNCAVGIILMLALLGSAWADVELMKVDLSCPGQAATKKGGNWKDFEVGQGCDGDRHDPRGWTDPDTNISFTCGQWGGHGNVKARGGDPICNTAYQQWEDEPGGMKLQIRGAGHIAGDYTIEVLHAWGGGDMGSLNVSGASSVGSQQNGSVMGTSSDADLLAATGNHTIVEYTIDSDGQAVLLEWSGIAKINGWILYSAAAPEMATDPNPPSGTDDVPADAALSWTAGASATSHDVYSGTDETVVENATTASDEYIGNQTEASYDPPGLLEFGQTFYWRIDELNGGVVKGSVWNFTVEDGKASEPNPNDGVAMVPADAVLSWTAGSFADSHDVYFGTNEDAVANATTASDEYMGNQSTTSFDPLGNLEEATMYYWRIDEVSQMTVKGDVWRFSTVGLLHLRVDLALPMWGTRDPWPGTAKEGWWPFIAGRWADMYMHDAVWERGEGAQGGVSPNTDGIAGTGVHVGLDISNGNGGFHNYHLCRCNLGGDCPPSGSVVGDPIASGWFHNIDWGGECTGDIHMRINDLPAGKYRLTSYHNHWEPCSQSTRNCLDCYSNMPPMQHVYATSIPVQGTMACEYVLGWGTGTGVVSMTEAYNIDVTSTTSDSEVATSVIEFETDGSDVLVVYDGGNNVYPDPARKGREGHKAILNAFELILVEPAQPPMPACWKAPTQCHGDSDNDGEVKGSDFLALKGSWYKCYGDDGYDPCADFDRDGCVKGSDFLILKSNWYKTVPADCAQGGTWPPQP